MWTSSFYTKTQEPYEFLLLRDEWKAKRERILIRDSHTCQMCGASSDDVVLHVHHKHYINGLDPWEYKDSELVTLCEDCHSKVHFEQKVPFYIFDGNKFVEACYISCSRCGGAGYLYQYRHVQNGICFRCHGQRYDKYIISCEDYAREHNIDLSEFEDGFRPIKQEAKQLIKEVKILQSRFDSEKVYVRIILKNGNYMQTFLDFSVKACAGDTLEVNSLRVKSENSKAGKKIRILKGTVVPKESEDEHRVNNSF